METLRLSSWIWVLFVIGYIHIVTQPFFELKLRAEDMISVLIICNFLFVGFWLIDFLGSCVTARCFRNRKRRFLNHLERSKSNTPTIFVTLLQFIHMTTCEWWNCRPTWIYNFFLSFTTCHVERQTKVLYRFYFFSFSFFLNS